MRARALSVEASRRIIAQCARNAFTAQRYAIVQACISAVDMSSSASNVKETLTMSSSRIRASRIARLTRVNPAALATRWRAWQALPIIEFKRQTRDNFTAFIRQDFSERFNESDAADYEYFREEVLLYMRRVKGEHQHVRNVDYGDVALVKRRAHEMAVCILWRRHRHLERVIRKYEDAMMTRDAKQIEDMCAEVERVAQSIDYKDHRRMHALHTAAERAMS